MRLRLEGVAWTCVVVLVVGLVYEALVATEVVSIGPVPGEGAPGAGIVLVASMLSLLVGAGAAVAHSTGHGARRAVVWPILPLAGATYTVVHWTAFDPYYAPTLRRYSEGGVAEPWIAVVVLVAVVAAGVAVLTPRLGTALGAVVLLAEALTIFVMPLGK